MDEGRAGRRHYSLAPIERADARVLVLGTMPGAVSLAEQRYYAHPHNAFWPIMAAVCGFAADAPYAQRCAGLRAARIAVWDMLHACEREGSLDLNIRNARPNDIEGFLVRHPQVERVLLNGGHAEKFFKRFVRLPRAVEVLRMPSTSPANARMKKAEKVSVWSAALQ